MSGQTDNDEIKEGIRELKKLMAEGFTELKGMILKVEKEHDDTRAMTIKYERDLFHYNNRQVEFEKQYHIDKNHIYTNMEKDIKKGIKEAIMSTKIWVVSFMIIVISLLVTIANRLDHNKTQEVIYDRTKKD